MELKTFTIEQPKIVRIYNQRSNCIVEYNTNMLPIYWKHDNIENFYNYNDYGKLIYVKTIEHHVFNDDIVSEAYFDAFENIIYSTDNFELDYYKPIAKEEDFGNLTIEFKRI